MLKIEIAVLKSFLPPRRDYDILILTFFTDIFDMVVSLVLKAVLVLHKFSHHDVLKIYGSLRLFDLVPILIV